MYIHNTTVGPIAQPAIRMPRWTAKMLFKGMQTISMLTSTPFYIIMNTLFYRCLLCIIIGFAGQSLSAQTLEDRTFECGPVNAQGQQTYIFRFRIRNNTQANICTFNVNANSPVGASPASSTFNFLTLPGGGCLLPNAVSPFFEVIYTGIPSGTTNYCYTVTLNGSSTITGEGCIPVPVCQSNQPCADINHEGIECIDGFLIYELNIVNTSTTQTITNMTLTPDDPTLSVSRLDFPLSYNNPLTYPVSVAPGAMVPEEFRAFVIQGAGAISGNYFTYTLTLTYNNGSTCILRCENPFLTVESALDAFPFPDCLPVCERTVITATPIELNNQTCCYQFSIDQQLEEVIVQSIQFTSQDGSLLNPTLLDPTNWLIVPNTPALSFRLFPNHASLPIEPGYYNNVFSLCRTNGNNASFEILANWDLRTPDGQNPIIQSCELYLSLPINCPATPPDTCTYTQINTGVNLPASGVSNFGPPPNNGYIYKNLTTPLDNTWTADFEFEITGMGANGGQVYPFAATNGTTPAHSTNSIGVVVYRPFGINYPLTLTTHLIYNGSTYIHVNCPIAIQQNKKYRVRLSRLDADNGKLELFDAASGTALGSCCFFVPAGLTGLKTLQVADFVNLGPNFWLQGSTTTLCNLTEPEVFCNGGPDCITITNDSLYCDNGLVKVRYTLTNNSATTIQSVSIDPLGDITPVPAFIPVTILPGATVTLPQSFDLVGSDVVPGQSFCYSLQAFNAPNGQDGLLSCIDSIIDNCKIIPLCSNCDSLSASITTLVSNNPDSCRFQVGMYIGEGVSGVQSGVENVQIVTSQPVTLLNTNPNWDFVPSTYDPNLINGIYQGGFPGFPTAGGYNLFEFTTAQGSSTTITIRWLDNVNTVICNKTVIGVCPNDSSNCQYTVTLDGTTEINAAADPIVFNNVNGNGPDERAWHTVGLQGNNWKAEFDLKITNIDVDGGAIIPFALTAGNGIFTCYPTLCSVDALGVQVWTPPSQQSPIFIAPYRKDNFLALPPICPFEINLNQAYRVHFERLTATQGRWSVFSNGQLLHECCFPIPEGITGLNTAQVSNPQGAWAARQISGEVSKVCEIMPAMGNCNNPQPPCVVIIKDSIFCDGNNVKVALTVQNNGSTAIQSIQLDAGSATVSPTFMNLNILPGQTVTTSPFMLSGAGVVAGQDICYSINVFAGPNGEQKLTCNDSIIDNCLTIPPCFNCDSVGVITQVFHTVPNPDPCCWFIHLQNDALPGTVHSVVFETADGTGLDFTPDQLLAQGFFSSVNSATPNLATLTFGGGAFPTGFLPQLYSNCLASGQSKTVYVFWRNEAGDVICIDTLVFQCPIPPINCDSISTSIFSAVKTIDQDACSRGLLVTNNNPAGVITGLTINASTPVNVTGVDWGLTPVSGLQTVLSSSGPIPTGTSAVLAFDLLPGQSTTLTIQFTAVDGTVCSYVQQVSCPEPSCGDITTDSFTCHPNGVEYCFNVENTGFGPLNYPMTIIPQAGLSATPSVVNVNVPAGASATYCVVLSGTLPAVGEAVCVTLSREGNTTCFEDCFEMPACINCDSLDFVLISPTVEDQDPCSFGLRITNNNPAGAINSVTFTSSTAINFSGGSGWTLTPASGSATTITASAPIPTGSSDPFTFTVPAGQTQSILISYFDLNGVLVCEDLVQAKCDSVPCDPDCYVNPLIGLNLSTGYQEETSTVINAGGIDNDWRLISAPDPGLLLPMPAFVIGQQSAAWGSISNANWISAYPYSLQNATNLPPLEPYVFENCFGVCDSTVLTINVSAHVDNQLKLDFKDGAGTFIGNLLNLNTNAISNFTNPPSATTYTTPLIPAGEYCLVAELRNSEAQSRMGLDMAITVTGENLVKDSCFQYPSNAIVGEKYWDKDMDGQRDNIVVEPGLSGWVIEIRDPVTNNLVATATTNTFGTWAVTNIPPGTYIVTEVQQVPWVQTQPVSPNSYTVTIGGNDGIGLLRFGNWRDDTPPCDFDLVLDSIASPADTCCRAVDIVNSITPSVLTKVQLSSSNGQPFTVTGLAAGFNVVQIDPQNVEITHSSGLIPTGTNNDVFEICIAAANSPVSIDIFYVKPNNTYCVDSLELNCPDVPDTCPVFSNSTLTCSDGQLEYCFTVSNTSGTAITVPVVLSAANATFSPNPVLVSVPANDTANFCVDLTGALPSAGDTVCISHTRINADSTTTLCFDTCLVVPPCSAIAEGCVYILGDDFECNDGTVQYQFYLKNGTNQPLRSIVLIPQNGGIEVVPDEIVIAGSGILPGQTGGPYTVELMGDVTPGALFCYIVEVRDQAQNNNPNYVHRDTISAGCRTIPACPQNLCLTPTNNVLTCEPVGRLYYNFSVSNPANSGVTLTEIYLHFPNSSDTSKFFVEPIALSPALAPGQSRNLRAEVFKWGNFQPGDPMCFGVIGTNTLGLAPLDPVLCDTTCLPLPACACETVCYECCTSDDLQLPTGISPNGDNMNDTYVINSGTKICPVEMRVYNRWGNLVWKEDNTYTNNWSGTNQAGETLPEGTYYVLIRIKATGQTLTNFVDLKRQ
jgi:gliding motility-associated-like protein